MAEEKHVIIVGGGFASQKGVGSEWHLLNRNLFQIINLRNVASIRFHTVHADNMQVFQGFAMVVGHTNLALVGNHGTQGIAITILASNVSAIRPTHVRHTDALVHGTRGSW